MVKSTHTPARNVRIPDELWDAAKARAELEGTDVSAVIRAALQRFVTRPPRQVTRQTGA